MSAFAIPALTYALDLAGTAVFAVSGALAAARQRLDLLGVLVVGLVTAVGGGTLRDLLLDRQPIVWLADPAYLLAVAAGCLASLFWRRGGLLAQRALLVADAIGLALFTLIGAEVALAQQLPLPSVLIVAAMTGAAGGLLRDVLCNEVPLVLRQDLYATAALLGAATLLVLRVAGIAAPLDTLFAAAVVLAVRLGALRWHWHLPRWQH